MVFASLHFTKPLAARVSSRVDHSCVEPNVFLVVRDGDTSVTFSGSPDELRVFLDALSATIMNVGRVEAVA